ncbi:hypothetical protein BDZ97DRAFT_88528 [Flammula alnicola]|nr:hypothetical protein BDZ97DRAFT_88528 [Flammula alnicola]
MNIVTKCTLSRWCSRREETVKPGRPILVFKYKTAIVRSYRLLRGEQRSDCITTCLFWVSIGV